MQVVLSAAKDDSSTNRALLKYLPFHSPPFFSSQIKKILFHLISSIDSSFLFFGVHPSLR